MNASDTRGKKAIEQQLADVVLCHAMTGDGMTTKKRLVIMDEVNNDPIHPLLSHTVAFIRISTDPYHYFNWSSPPLTPPFHTSLLP